MGEMIEFPSNGSTAGGYLAVPEGGNGPGFSVKSLLGNWVLRFRSGQYLDGYPPAHQLVFA